MQSNTCVLHIYFHFTVFFVTITIPLTIFLAAGKVTAKSKKDNWFETPLGKAYLCPAQEVILLYSEDQHVATARMKDTHLQPYDVEDGKFSSSELHIKYALG